MLSDLFRQVYFPCKLSSKPGQLLPGMLTLCILCSSSFQGKGQKFPASQIPDSLKENANVIIRLEELSYVVKSTGEAISHERHVYTILNEKGDSYASYSTHYNNASVTINSVTGYLYDASGKEISHFKKKDMEDLPAYDGSSFVNDERIKAAELNFHSYPYTVDFEEEDRITELTHISGWMPQGHIGVSVQKSMYNLTFPVKYTFRYRMLHDKIQPTITEKDEKKSMTWEVHNLKAHESEPYAYFYNFTPYLLIGLGDVQMGSYKGNMNTWDDYARFYGSLQKGRDNLPEETKRKVHDLIKGLNDPQAKVAVLYNYLQQNSHYVGIQLGIGGWQTYDAEYVATKKYGDCKALSNFMIALLKEAGIKANAVVIKGGKENMDFVPDFTYDPFNHVICCVPLEKDTIWLECTSQSLPPGYLSEFTANRYGLFIGEDGGNLIHTPAYRIGDNIQDRKIIATLDSDGNLTLESNTAYKALCQDDIESRIHGESKEKLLIELKSEFNLPTYEVVSVSYSEDYTKRIPVIHEKLQLKVSNYAPVSGKRIFINPDILTRSPDKLAEDKNRTLNIELKDEYKHIDSIEITIPTGYEAESKSGNLELVSKFGKFTKKTIVNPGKIIYLRIREQYLGNYPPDNYSEFVKYSNDVYDADHTQIVLVKKQ